MGGRWRRPGHPLWVPDGNGLAERPLVDELVGEPGGVPAWNAPAFDRDPDAADGSDFADETAGDAAREEAEESLVATAVASGLPGRWVSARDLRIGDRLLTRDGRTVLIESVAVRAARLTTYNLQVAEVHTYAVGPAAVLVHNTSPKGKKGCRRDSCDKTKGPKVKTLLDNCRAIATDTKFDYCEQTRDKLLASCRTELKQERRRQGAGDVAKCPAAASAECCWPDDDKVDKSNDPEKLRRRLQNGVGGPKDVDPAKVSDAAQAHHIVEGGRQSVFAKRNREILFEVCINLNDAINGVFLPQSSNNNSNCCGRVYHNYTFGRTRGYDEYVNEELTRSGVRGNRTKIEAALARIRRKLEQGQAPWLPGTNVTSYTGTGQPPQCGQCP